MDGNEQSSRCAFGFTLLWAARRAIARTRKRLPRGCEARSALRCLRGDEGHDEQISSIAIAADGRRVVSASRDATLKVWDLDSRSERLSLSGHMGVSSS